MKKLKLLERDYRTPTRNDFTRGSIMVLKYVPQLVNDLLYTHYLPQRMKDISEELDGRVRMEYLFFTFGNVEEKKLSRTLEERILKKELELCTKLISVEQDIGDKIKMIMDYAYQIDMIIEGA